MSSNNAESKRKQKATECQLMYMSEQLVSATALLVSPQLCLAARPNNSFPAVALTPTGKTT